MVVQQYHLHIMPILLPSVPGSTWNRRHQIVVPWQVEQPPDVGLHRSVDHVVREFQVVLPLNLFQH